MKKTSVRVFLAAAAMLIVRDLGQAQELTYSLVTVQGASPSARFDGTLAYDPAGRQLFLFGGQDSAPKNDLWSFSLDRHSWEEVRVSGPPPARFGHTLIFDPVRRRLVVFGGQANGFFSDVWAFDIARQTWQQLSPNQAAPSKRYGHSAVYDATRDRMIISHGFTDAGRFDDTFSFDFTRNVWADLTSSGTKPLRRCLHHAILDQANQQMYLYGGCSSGFGPCPQGDLWAFDLNKNTWTERTGRVNPPPREHYGMAFDSLRKRIILFGGRGQGLLDDTWEYDPGQGSWEQKTPAGTRPSARERHETSFANDKGTAFFFGGTTSSGLTNELWMLGPAGISLNGFANAFSGETGAVAPGEIVSVFGSGLGPAEGLSLGFDPATQQLPVSKSGVTATWNGIAAPLYFLRADQLNMQVPYELENSREANLVITVNGQSNAALTIPVSATRPGLLPKIWNQDGSLNLVENPESTGRIIVLYATGQGATIPASRTGAAASNPFPKPAAPVSVLIGGFSAEILFRGQAPGTAGVMQINTRIPEQVASGAAVPIVLTIGTAESQPRVTLAVR